MGPKYLATLLRSTILPLSVACLLLHRIIVFFIILEFLKTFSGKMLESRTALTLAAGLAGTLFLGYCVYFDQQRRRDPDFKKKLRDRRRAAANLSPGGLAAGGPLPDMSDHEAMQRFFLQQVQLGEELLAAGDLEKGVEHLGQAVAVCGQTQQLLGVLQQTLPAPIFHMLLQRLPIVSERLRSSMKNSKPSPTLTAVLQEEDVE